MRQKKSALIVDDQENWREALSSILRKDGFSTETVASLQAAEEALESKEYSLLVADVRLVDERPGNVDGLYLLAKARNSQEEADHPAVIIMTGYVSEQVERAALEKYKVDHFLLKNPPGGFDVGKFRTLVNQLMAVKI